MGGISERLKELAIPADEGIGGLKKFPESANVGEGGELPGPQELHMPRIDTGIGEGCLSIASMMKFGILLYGRLEVGAVLAR